MSTALRLLCKAGSLLAAKTPLLIKQSCLAAAQSRAAAASTGIPLLLAHRNEIATLSDIAGDKIQINVAIIVKKLSQSGIDVGRDTVRNKLFQTIH